MNLAEIRKKAQKEKSIENSVSAPDQLPPEEKASENVSVHDEGATEDSAPVSSHEILPCSELEVRPEMFDPVAVLMAGREAAGSPGNAYAVPRNEVSADHDTSQKYLCFRVSAEEYAINLMDIKEIIKPREVTEVPHAPAFIRGIISLRGIIIPILDMRSRLGFTEAPSTGKERFVIVKKGEEFCGLLVDEVYQVITLAQQPIERPPAVLEGTDRELVRGIGRYEERIFILMDLERVLDITLT